MIFVLTAGIIGQLITFVLMALAYDVVCALVVAPAGGVLAALAACLFLSLKK